MAEHHIFGTRSLRELRPCHEELQELAERALKLSVVDFSIVDGIRTKAEQRILVANGASKTMNSRHLTGDAIDAVPWVNGAPRWEWPLIYKMGVAFHTAAVQMKTDFRWGGVWDRSLFELDPRHVDEEHLKHEVAAYTRRHPGPDFLDGPHYERLRD